MNKLENGTLVRFVFQDEYLDHYADLYELNEPSDFEIGHNPTDIINWLESLVVYLDFESVKKADKHEDKVEAETGRWMSLRFATRGIIVDCWVGKENLWHKVLIDKKTVWTQRQHLVKLCNPTLESEE